MNGSAEICFMVIIMSVIFDIGDLVTLEDREILQDSDSVMGISGFFHHIGV